MDQPARVGSGSHHRPSRNPPTAEGSIRHGREATDIDARIVILQNWARTDRTGPRAPLIFLDRDGVLVDLSDRYALTAEAVCELPGVRKGVSRLASAGFKAVVVTNQSGIGRRLVSKEQALDINSRILRKVDPDRKFIEFTLICPHTPDDNCKCRKPQTQGIEHFVGPLHPLRGQWFVGDQVTDLQCAEALAMKPVLVLTGHGRETLHRIRSLPRPPRTVEDFSAFVDLALYERDRPKPNECRERQ